ncbi:MAG: hypothetical protein US81_C0006G0027 [Parcubacteria group bacterium GW2011_GWE2_38_18]|nr:MAG: hypothetical protein US81_C0006G0027 [Parcubacteria group bacterium GW2011_GWE2_38_18]
MKNKKIIILWHNGGRLANQLWLYINLFSYAIEKDIEIKNPSFYEYARYFKNEKQTFASFLSYFLPRKIIKLIYLGYAKISLKINNKNSISADALTLLPPSTEKYPDIFKKLETGEINSLYTWGWLFRNPEGIKKHHQKIIEHFKPKDTYLIKAEKHLDSLKNFKHIVGVHIRQGDYKTINDDTFTFFQEEEVNIFLIEYLRYFNLTDKETCFVIVSDGEISLKKFNEKLNIRNFKGNLVEDLFLLAKTDIILGSNSSYGQFAAYYGNIPHIAFNNKGTDWSQQK